MTTFTSTLPPRQRVGRLSRLERLRRGTERTIWGFRALRIADLGSQGYSMQHAQAVAERDYPLPPWIGA